MSAPLRLSSQSAAGLLRLWWLAPVTGLVAGAVAFVFAGRQQPTYSATATAVVRPASEVSETTDVLRALETLDRRTVIATFARIASTRDARIRSESRLGLEPDELSRYSVNASVLSSTNILRIRVEGPDPDRAAALANTTIEGVEEDARRLYRLFAVERVESAEAPRGPVHPDPVRSAGVGGFIGFLLGALVASLSGAIPRLGHRYATRADGSSPPDGSTEPPLEPEGSGVPTAGRSRVKVGV